MTVGIVVLWSLLATGLPVRAQRRRNVPQRASWVAIDHLALMDRAIADSISRHELPGAVVLVSHHGRTVWRKAYGSRAVEPVREAMAADTIFDLASLTKVIATATSIMILVERGQLRLSDPVSKYIPELKGEGRDRVTIELLLTHRAGYAPDFNLAEKWSTYDEAMKRLYREPLKNKPGSRFVYSDIGFITLGEVVRRISGETLDMFAARNIFQPLGMHDTGFKPREELNARIAPRNGLVRQQIISGGPAAGFRRIDGSEEKYTIQLRSGWAVWPGTRDCFLPLTM